MKLSKTNIMLKIIAALLFVTYYVEGTNGPILHGSGIVTQKVGSVTLTFNYNDQKPTIFEVRPNVGEKKKFTISTAGECVILDENGGETKTVFGSPCKQDTDQKNTVVLTIFDVTWQSGIYITYQTQDTPPKSVVYSVIFAPDCKFSVIKDSNEAVVAESIPLSRFVKGQTTVPITFAVEGAESNSNVELWLNGASLCTWKGVTKQGTCATNADIDLTKDTSKNMRVFKKDFSPPTGNTDVYTWKTSGNDLSITVDKTQGGESSEMDGCREVTTSVAPSVVVSHIIVANLVLAMALL